MKKVELKLPKELLVNASKVLNANYLSLNDAVKMFLAEMVRKQEIPVDTKISNQIFQKELTSGFNGRVDVLHFNFSSLQYKSYRKEILQNATRKHDPYYVIDTLTDLKWFERMLDNRKDLSVKLYWLSFSSQTEGYSESLSKLITKYGSQLDYLQVVDSGQFADDIVRIALSKLVSILVVPENCYDKDLKLNFQSFSL